MMTHVLSELKILILKDIVFIKIIMIKLLSMQFG